MIPKRKSREKQQSYRNPTIGAAEVLNTVRMLGYDNNRQAAVAFGVDEMSMSRAKKGIPPSGVLALVIEFVNAAIIQGYSWQQVRNMIDHAHTTHEVIRDLALMGATEEHITAILARTTK